MFTWIDFHGKLFDLKTRNKNEPTVLELILLIPVDRRVFFSLSSSMSV